MNTDTLYYAQVLAFWIIAIELAILLVFLAVAFPELLGAIEALGRAV